MNDKRLTARAKILQKYVPPFHPVALFDLESIKQGIATDSPAMKLLTIHATNSAKYNLETIREFRIYKANLLARADKQMATIGRLSRGTVYKLKQIGIEY